MLMIGRSFGTAEQLSAVQSVSDIDYGARREEREGETRQQTIVVIFAQIKRQAEAPRILFTTRSIRRVEDTL